MSLLAAGAIIGGGVSLVKGLFGAVQARKAQKNINKLLSNPVTYKRPEEYAKELAMREQGLSASMPGQGQMYDNISSAGATARGAAEKGAISSNTYGSAVGDIFSKQLQAYQDLGIKSAEWRDLQKEKYVNTLGKGAEYSDTEYQENVLRPYETRLNIATGNKQAGMTNMANGFEGVASTAMNFFGTKYAQDVMKGMMPSSGWGKDNQLLSSTMPNPSYSPQENLLNTLQGMKPKIN